VWHVSVCERNRKMEPIPTRLVLMKKAPTALGRELLAGVGTGETFMHRRELAFHIRRSLSEEEIATLSPEWLAIPAVDMAG
jgi:hypothetical protein